VFIVGGFIYTKTRVKRKIYYFFRKQLKEFKIYKVLNYKKMEIRKKIQTDIKEAMKAGDSNRRDVLRMLDSMIKNAEIEKGKREEGLNDDEVIELVARSIKQRKDSAEQYKNGGREDLAEKEIGEIKILAEYLPEQLGEDELRQIVKKEIESVGAQSKADAGKVIGAVMSKVKGRTEGGLVKRIVEEEL
jgi:hypothetical protein